MKCPKFIVIQISTFLTMVERLFLKFYLILKKKLKKEKLFKNGPRRIDLDIIFYNRIILKKNLLIIPHPRAHLRDFVLNPICEINPFFIHPIQRKTIKELINKLRKNYILKKIIRQKNSVRIF